LRGTSGYFAPELIEEQDYDTAVDVFALGITLFSLLAGYDPFFPANNFGGGIDMDARYWSHISAECQDIVRQMLCLDPKDRITCAQAINHPWFTANLNPTAQLDIGPAPEKIPFASASTVQKLYEQNGMKSPFLASGSMTYRFVDGQNNIPDKGFPTPESTTADGRTPTTGYAPGDTILPIIPSGYPGSDLQHANLHSLLR